MNTGPKFSALHLMNITYALEDLVDNGKHVKVVEQISRDLLDKLEKGVLTDFVSRTQVIMEVNALANAKLGNIEVAMKNIVKSGTIKNSARESNYFQDSKAKYYTRYSLILAASGEYKKALDTLTKALRNADSNPKLVSTYKEIYKAVKGSMKGADKEIKMLQDEAYHHYYKELQSSYITTTGTREGFLPATKKNSKPFKIFTSKIPFDEIELPDLKGNMVRFADYKGKVLVIDFWSTVCTPCMAAFAGFEKVVAEYKNDPFQLFIIDLYEPLNTVKSLVAKKEVKLDVLHDESDKSFSIQATPTKIVFDPMGNIRFYSAGYAGSTDREYYKLKAMVEITKAHASVDAR
ncbi:MAG: redoxin domain-containing protein [Flavobacterium sp.]|nr:MAG: redoxin domain-containing protein [Flavobacterium sp.]